MEILWLTLAIVFISGYFAQRYSTAAAENGISHREPNLFFSFIAVAVLVLVSGLRVPSGTNVIGDTGTYTRMFVHASESVFDGIKEFTLYQNDSGFMILLSSIKEFISTDPQVFIFICALITNGLIVITLYKYSPMFELSLFLYMATGSYIVAMNGIRQYLVASILFLSVKLMEDGKWLPFFLLVLVVSTMHISALVFIPIYFLVRLEPWSRWILLTLGASIVTLLLFNQVGTFLLGSLDGTQYRQYKEIIQIEGHGANIVRVFVAAIPVVLAYFNREKIKISNNKFINILINFSVINLVFYILALQNWLFARMCIYFALYGLLLLPWLIKNLFTQKTTRAAYWLCILFYLIFYHFEMVSQLYWTGYSSNFIGF